MIGTFLLIGFLSQLPVGPPAQSGVVTGVVRTEAGLPIEGLRVAVAPAGGELADSLLESLGQTGSDGRYRLENISPGRYNILLGRGGLAQYYPGVTDVGRATTILVTAGATVAIPDMVLARTKVSGRVIDLATGDSRRIERISICCDYSQFDLSRATGQVNPFTTSVADDGSFVFPAIPPGNYTIHASDPAIVGIGQPIAVGDDDVSVEIKVSGGVEVDGTIYDQVGKPATVNVRLRPQPSTTVFESHGLVGGPSVTFTGGALSIIQTSIERITTLLQQSVKVKTVSTGLDGAFSFSNVLPGAYVLELNVPGLSILEREIHVGVQGFHESRLQVPVIQGIGRVVAAAGAPLPKLKGTVRFVSTGSATRIIYGFPDDEGRFSFLLSPGEYRIFTENLSPSVVSVVAGSKDVTDTMFLFDGANPEIVITVEP